MRIPIPLLVHCSGPFEDDDTRFVLKQPGHYLPGGWHRLVLICFSSVTQTGQTFHGYRWRLLLTLRTGLRLNPCAFCC